MKRKGFTLIELLAVIVILAIIALIATPTILGVIEKAKKGAAESSALGYIDAVEKYMVLHEMDSTKYPYSLTVGNKYYIIPDSEIEVASNKSILPVVYAEEEQTTLSDIYLSDFIKVKGEEPSDGYVVIGEKNTVAEAMFVVNNYEVSCEKSDNCEVIGKHDSSTIKATSVTINNEETEIELGQTLQLTATVLPENATNKTVKWISSDSSVATVDESGLVTAIKEGDVTITATTSNGKISTKNINIKKVVRLTDSNGNSNADIGETITIGSENFYVINNDGTTVSMLSYYNLNAGGVYSGSSWKAYTNPTYKQDENMKGYVSGQAEKYGTVKFADKSGWSYSNNATIPTSYYTTYLSTALTNYDTYIKSLGANITSTRLITYNELINLGCITGSCSSSGKAWLYSSSYWTGSALSGSAGGVWYVNSAGVFNNACYDVNSIYGVRPVLDVLISEI